MERRMCVPLIWDEAARAMVERPDPYDPNVPLGSIVVVADDRCNFVGPDEPIPGDAAMVYRWSRRDPLQWDARANVWPENEWPCITVDYWPEPGVRTPDRHEWAVIQEIDKAEFRFEYAIWNGDLRGEGGGARDPQSALGRLWPEPGRDRYVFTVIGVPQEQTPTEEVEVVDVPKSVDPGDEQPEQAPDVPVPVPVFPKPIDPPIKLTLLDNYGYYHGDDGRKYIQTTIERRTI